MADTTVIGNGAFVRGRVSGAGDLEIAGRIEGDVTVGGEVLVETSGLVAAPITARRIVVRGAVRGDLVAEEALVIESGARVVGDLRAPRIAIAEGGLVRGHVQTGAAGAAKPRAAQATAARPAARTESAPARTAAPAPAPAKKAAPVTAPAARTTANGKAPRTAPAAARPGPPPPVVPALKKGTKAVQKKRG